MVMMRRMRGVNLLLRNYVSLKQYELAEQLRSKTVLPSSNP